MKWFCVLGLLLGLLLLFGCGGAGAGGGEEVPTGDDEGGEGETPEIEDPVDESQVAADANGPYAALLGELPLIIEFDGTGTTDPEGEIATYRWSPGDGSEPVDSTASRVTHAYYPTEPWEYEVTLTVLNSKGEILDFDDTVARFRSVPESSFTVVTEPSEIRLGGETVFDGSGSNDVDDLGYIAEYQWSFDHGTAYIPDRISPDPVITESFSALGEISVTLVVVNDDGFESDPTQQTINVEDSEGARIIIQ